MSAIAEVVPTAKSATERVSAFDSFQRYYEEAGPDYSSWSRAFNMHFGYFRWGMNPFDRETMLEQMNLEVLDRLHLSPAENPRVLDMGCGLGATLRSFARRLPNADLRGITLVPWQLEQGTRMNQECPEGQQIKVSLGDYQHTSEPAASFDAICAIESSCYSAGANKATFLREAHRLLRSGGRIVVADGFMGPRKLWGLQKAIYRRTCECWALDTFGQVESFTSELARTGFRDIVIERIQSRVTPSVLHIPSVTLRFLVTAALSRRQMTRARWNNVLAPLLLPLVSYPLGPLAYYIISATRA